VSGPGDEDAAGAAAAAPSPAAVAPTAAAHRLPPAGTTTARLVLRELAADDADAAFIVELLNDPDWLRYIGDRNVRTAEDALAYLARGPIAMYERHGFGLWLVARRGDGAPLGMAGLIKRDSLPDVDIGFAFLPAYRRAGFAREAAEAVLALAWSRYALRRVVAIVSPGNAPSRRLLERLGMHVEGEAPGSTEADPLVLYGCSAP